MAPANSTALKFSILLIILAFESREANIFNPTITVSIKNVIVVPGDRGTSITVHCKSKDDDLGFHTIRFGDLYSFSFHDNAFGGTLFFCSFTWPEDPRRHYLDIYNQREDNCQKCNWIINQNGGCLNSHGCGDWKSIE
ncbi:S-protein homolog 2-like [Trifolium pratense]|uniref:S-protein homolog 2-like n=1 Tax=Trifolium pratense TaxID=57577 RepID=UPI001E696DD3|nr:S-protein homolog 2-like [Trifolium pratense]